MSASAATHVKRCLRANPGAIPAPAPAPDFERHQRKCAICRHPEREAIEELFIYWHSAQSITDLFDLPDWSTMYRHARAAGLYELRRRNVRAVLDLLLENADAVEPTPMSLVASVRAYACLTDSGSWHEPEKRVHMTTVVRREDSTAAGATDAGSQRAPAASSPAGHEPRTGSTGGTGSEPVHDNPVPSSSSSLQPLPASQSSMPLAHTPSMGQAPPSPAPASVATHHSFTLRNEGSLPSNRQSVELESRVSHSKQTTELRSNRQISPHAPRALPLAQSHAMKAAKK